MQEGLYRSPGSFSAAVSWRLEPGVSLRGARDAAADVLEALGDGPRARAVVGVRASHAGIPSLDVLPRGETPRAFPSTQADVFVQVAADDREALLEALHAIYRRFAGVLTVDDEVLGDRIGPGREPFGFLDGVRIPDRKLVDEICRIRSGRLEGGSFLLYLRFQQDLNRFAALDPRAQEDVFGRTRDGEPVARPPAGAHVPLTMRYRPHGRDVFIRRGFPFRSQHEEGIAFVAASSEPDTFARALDTMLGADGPADRLLGWVTAVSGAVYFAPSDADGLRRIG